MRKLAPTILGFIAITLCAPNAVVALPLTSGMSATAAAAAKDQLASPVYYRRGHRVVRRGVYRGAYYGGYRRYGYNGGYGPYAYSYPSYYGGYSYPYYAYGYRW